VKLEVRLFAAARQYCQASSVEIELATGSTVAALRTELIQQYPALAPLGPHLMFAVANNYVGDATVLDSGMQVACIPPVSGGWN
jgi:molybdopterin converting factor small subunit